MTSSYIEHAPEAIGANGSAASVASGVGGASGVVSEPDVAPSLATLTVAGSVAGGDQQQMVFPHFASGPVVKGFGRGSKQLGIPTANFPTDVVEQLPAAFHGGVYYGWAQVNSAEVTGAASAVHKMVLSVGNNPYFNNKQRTMETYVMHIFDADFYGANLRVAITGYLRQMDNYSNLDELIAAIHKDIADAERLLDEPDQQAMRQNAFFAAQDSVQQ